MRFLVIFLCLFSLCGTAQAEQQYFFSGDSPTIVKNRIKVNLKRRSKEDVSLLSRFTTSFKQEGDLFYLYGKREFPSLDGSPQPVQLLYTVTVSGSVYNRTYVHVVPAPTKDDLLVSNIEYFMKGVVEKRESRAFTPRWDDDRELRQVLSSTPYMKIATSSNMMEKLSAKAKTVFAQGKVSDGYHEAQVLQVIADAREIIAYSRAALGRYERAGENPVINGVNLKDAFRKTLRSVEKQIKTYQQYKKDYLDSTYAENRARYNILQPKLNQAYGYGYSNERMFSGSYCSSSDGGTVLAGETEVNDGIRQPLLLKFAENGELQFNKIFPAYSGGRSLFRSITEVEEGKLIGIVEKTKGSNTSCFVYKMGHRGSPLWQKEFHNIILNGVVFDPGGFYYAIGRTYDANSSAFLAKLDLQGNIINRKLFGTEQGSSSLVEGVVLGDHSLIVVGYGTPSGETASKATMLHLSATGNLISQSFHGTVGSLFSAIAVAPDKTIFVGGTMKADNIKKGVIAKLDSQGNEIWQTVIFARLNDQDSEVFDVKSKGDGAILVGSAMEYGFVAKINGMGDILWRDVYGEDEKIDSLSGLCLSQSGKILVAGETYSYASMGGQNLWHFELDDKPGKSLNMPPENLETAFLAENKNKAGVVTLASGAQYKILREGTGSIPSVKDTVQVHYHGTFINGEVFDSTYDRRESLEMEVGDFVEGLQELLQKMKVGCKWQLFIPATLAYGEAGRGSKIPPNKTLIYEMELLEIKWQ